MSAIALPKDGVLLYGCNLLLDEDIWGQDGHIVCGSGIRCGTAPLSRARVTHTPETTVILAALLRGLRSGEGEKMEG